MVLETWHADGKNDSHQSQYELHKRSQLLPQVVNMSICVTSGFWINNSKNFER